MAACALVIVCQITLHRLDQARLSPASSPHRQQHPRPPAASRPRQLCHSLAITQRTLNRDGQPFPFLPLPGLFGLVTPLGLAAPAAPFFVGVSVPFEAALALSLPSASLPSPPPPNLAIRELKANFALRPIFPFEIFDSCAISVHVSGCSLRSEYCAWIRGSACEVGRGG